MMTNHKPMCYRVIRPAANASYYELVWSCAYNCKVNRESTALSGAVDINHFEGE